MAEKAGDGEKDKVGGKDKAGEKGKDKDIDKEKKVLKYLLRVCSKYFIYGLCVCIYLEAGRAVRNDLRVPSFRTNPNLPFWA